MRSVNVPGCSQAQRSQGVGFVTFALICAVSFPLTIIIMFAFHPNHCVRLLAGGMWKGIYPFKENDMENMENC